MRLNFINWRPDMEDVGNDGLTVADNVIHEPEGYKPIHLASAGGFVTTGGLGASSATILSIVSKQVGAQNDTLSAWVGSDGGLNIGLNGVTATSPTTGYPLSFNTTLSIGQAAAITVFDVSEYAGKISFQVEAQAQTASPNTTVTLRHAGYMDF